MNPAALQTAIYQKLIADSTLIAMLSTEWGYDAVFSDVPQEHAEDKEYYPFVSFGPDTTTPFDDKDTDGGEALVQVSAWSRSGDYIEVKNIADRIHDLLHRTSLSISGQHHVTTGMESVDFSIDPDGETRRALMQFRVLYQDS